MDTQHIRNFCIIAHIDHGKSTLADRFLEITGTIAPRDMREQMLDQMDLERERGITIKLQPVTMYWQGYILNLIDTPGHVDFTYEVSRSLACVEGAILLVDASQGIQAQTLANYRLAQEQGLAIIPVINKVDLPAADPEGVAEELGQLLRLPAEQILKVSAKDGTGVAQLLEAVIKQVPPPEPGAAAGARALIFDSFYDDYRGVVCAIRIVDGELMSGQRYTLLGSQQSGTILEVGTFSPKPRPASKLPAGAIGYAVTGLKDIQLARVGDTLAVGQTNLKPLPGYRAIRPMVFAGFFPGAGDSGAKLREGLNKLKLNDSSLTFEGEHSPALGFGFRCGFLGLLHLDITRERLKREYGLNVTVTTPSVAYEVDLKNGSTLIARSALELPLPDRIAAVREPVVKVDIVTPGAYLGNLMKVAQDYRGLYLTTDYLGHTDSQGRAILRYHLPLSAILVDFYDQIKSVSSGYASLNYEFLHYQSCEVRRLDILVADEPVEALSSIVYADEAYQRGRSAVSRLREILPRQMFEVKIQACLGGKVIASERLPAMRKDVLKRASSGGDVTRKRKLLEKQKAGKRRLKLQGRVAIPPEAYLALVSRQD
ncbi:MAG: elongation factor 4 [Candidatus Kerfeldbacteria bacterium]|nr:elongation factor 4 [Candidatus Kerfeldbacteria bacterium]